MPTDSSSRVVAAVSSIVRVVEFEPRAGLLISVTGIPASSLSDHNSSSTNTAALKGFESTARLTQEAAGPMSRAAVGTLQMRVLTASCKKLVFKALAGLHVRGKKWQRPSFVPC